MTAPPRTLFVNQSSDIGGGELALLDFVRDLPGAHVAVFAPGPFLDALHAAGVSATVVEAGGLMKVKRSAGLIAAARGGFATLGLTLRLARLARGFDVVYANSQKAFMASAPAAWLARRPFIWHLHDILSPEHFSPALRRASILLANGFVDRVIANSQATKAAFREQGGRTPVSVVHNGIDPLPFADGHDASARERLAQQIDSGHATIVGLFGRLAPWKGQEIALRALAGLPDHHLVLVGGPLFGEEAFEQRLHMLADELGIAARVHFFGFRRDVAAIMRSVDVILHCSTSPEPFGRVIVEGMMAGAPVLASAAGGALEIVTDGITGRLIQPGNPTHLANTLIQLRNDPAQAKALATRGRDHALRTFGLAPSTALLCAALDAVVDDCRH